MSEMSENELASFKAFLKAYEHQYRLNSYMREAYNEDMEYYLGYRNENEYPLAYNMTFNKLMPRVQNILARFMEQLYQGGPSNLVGVRPRKGRDVDRAQRVEGLLNYQLENLNSIDDHGGGYFHHLTWMFNALAWGTGITKMYWRKEERITPRRITIPMPQFDEMGRIVGVSYFDRLVEEPQVVYEQPYSEVLHNKTFIPHPHYKSIQKMPFVFCVYERSIDYIKSMADKGVFRNIDNLGWSSKVRSSESSYTSTGNDAGEAFAKSLSIEGVYQEELQSEYNTPNVDIIEGYGRHIFPEDETPYEIGSGIKIKGTESEAIFHIGNYKTLLSIQKNKYGTRPFFKISAYPHPELFWDVGLIRLGKDVQEQYNTLGNTRFQNVIMLVNQMMKVRESADIDPESLIWKPFGLVPVEDMGDIEPIITPDVSQTGIFREQEKFFEDTLSEMTGETEYNMGSIPNRQEHVGTMYSLQKVGQARAKLLLMTMDYQGFQPFLKHMMRLNTYHLPPNFEVKINQGQNTNFSPMMSGDYHVDYDFSARYTAMEPALGKMFRAQQLIQYAQMWVGSPYLKQYQFMKSILEMLDFPGTNKFLNTPEEVQQQQIMAMQEQTRMQMANAALQDNLAAKDDDRTLQREVVKALLK
ncbi:MAG: hypothetical protein SWO11_18840 [Thermodesulfobacteriota bacterium]|nr:hypothetical protein [Thermodesulfobacteriota bacterium]